ncbi:DUF1799 domain-containing protein [Yersinia enterocolitica]|nr:MULTISPECIES: DUF1799 domain-containing protein [Yersinia]EKN4715347.1 DUF1799 domain-containing protein [Yersinia enterocolitica]EKN4770372.1 DUF1799 domain-containing protein [Yersinia enterocolitica]EKN4774163.1 DUF1799 domain-containing protein [Yersinia enterocolitica]EKN5956646.1 hypothetical protein [Yersinia enterocolitica]EKN5999725.1 hypothetical protein [Yersinia enterocolitica]
MLAAFGLTLDDYDDEIVEVGPDVWPSFNVFHAMTTQWRTGVNGVTGLDYNCLSQVMDWLGVEDEATVFSDIRVMEQAALATMYKGGDKQ